MRHASCSETSSTVIPVSAAESSVLQNTSNDYYSYDYYQIIFLVLALLLMDEILHRFSSAKYPLQTLNLSIDCPKQSARACARMDEILHHPLVLSTLTLEGRGESVDEHTTLCV